MRRCGRRRSGALDGSGALGAQRDRGVAGGGRLALLEGAVRRPEAQGVGERLLALADLVAGVDVEEPDRLEQLARALAQRGLDVGRRDRGVDDERDVLLGDGVRREGRAPGAGAPPGRSARRGRPRRRRCASGRPNAWHTVGCTSPAWPTTSPSTDSSAQRPGCHGRQLDGGRGDLEAERCGDGADGLDGVGPGRPAGPRPTSRRTTASPEATTARCSGCAGSAASSASNSSSVGRRSTGRIAAGPAWRGSVTVPVSKIATSVLP